MKINLIFVAAFLLLSFNVSAQNDVKQVEIAAEYLKQALISGRQADLQQITSDSLVYSHSNGKTQNKDEFIKQLVTNQSDFVTIDVQKQNIKVVGETAIVTHRIFCKTNDGGNSGEVYLGIMLIFTKKNGEWKLLARQAFKV